jgi:3'-phosphoadenosine 5'-phosphosulfate (PAPS) 3'-phosphatase
MSTDLSFALEAARRGAETACGIMMSNYRGSFQVYTKSGAYDRAEAVLTEPDIQCDRALQSHFSALFPEHVIVSEESEGVLQEGWHEKEWVWYIDPIDGSMSFLDGTDNFGVSICLAHEGEPVLGVLKNPARGLEAWSAAAFGAFVNGERAVIDFPSRWPPRLIMSSRQRRKTSYRRTVDILRPEKITLMESVVTKAIMLLMGEADLYFSLPYEVFGGGCPRVWDVAAAAAVVQEAGGAAVDIYGDSIRFTTSDLLWRKGFIFCHRDILDRSQSLLGRLTEKRGSGVPPDRLGLE